jgi:succinylglutamate desuccinylase
MWLLTIFADMLEKGERLIGRHSGAIKGPLMICLGGMHGNELAGLRALELIFKMLEVEPITNPEFVFKGRLVGFRGNLSAIKSRKRFNKIDLNRIWTPELIAEVLRTPIDDLKDEYLEMHQLIHAVHHEIVDYEPDRIVVLDLHTTSCRGGIFSIVRDDLDSIELGIELHAPVIRGMLAGLRGTTLHYFHHENFDIPITSISFESGQHVEPLSINRAIAGIINCMRTSGIVQAEHVENQHDKLLIKHSENLPKVADLIYGHRILPGDQFTMVDGFNNFDLIKKGTLLAHDRHGPIIAKEDGLLLMPLYQPQGEDGFFLIEKSDPTSLSQLTSRRRAALKAS